MLDATRIEHLERRADCVSGGGPDHAASDGARSIAFKCHRLTGYHVSFLFFRLDRVRSRCPHGRYRRLLLHPEIDEERRGDRSGSPERRSAMDHHASTAAQDVTRSRPDCVPRFRECRVGYAAIGDRRVRPSDPTRLDDSAEFRYFEARKFVLFDERNAEVGVPSANGCKVDPELAIPSSSGDRRAFAARA